MEPIMGLLVAGTVGSVVYLVLWWQFQERAKAWEAAAEEVGLVNVQTVTFFGWNSKLTGDIGSLHVRLESYQRDKNEGGTRVVINGLRHGNYALTIRPEGIGSIFEKAFGEKELEIGDEPFDSAAYLQGSPALIRAIFDATTRRALQEVLQGHLWVKDHQEAKELDVRARLSENQFVVEIREPPFGNVRKWIPGALRALVSLGERLVRPEDLAVKIAANITEDPVPDVRLANLLTLSREFAAHPAARPALLQALADSSSAVRLHAAMAAGPDGQQTLLDLAVKEECPDQLAAQAIAALGSRFPLALAIDRLKRASSAGRASVARACIDVIGRAGQVEGVEALAGLFAATGSELAAAAASALGAIGGDAAQLSLIAALEHEAPEVRIAAAEALARCGSPRAVVPLRRCTGDHPLDVSLRRATRQAIAEIQARLTGASPGQLSIAGQETGQVSLVDEDQRGRLSLEQ